MVEQVQYIVTFV